jgi:class 3 adenylate cyclase/tetratricopeptide (TPR) repeat protein
MGVSLNMPCPAGKGLTIHMPESDSQKITELKNTIQALEAQRATLGDAVVDASIAALQNQISELESQPEPVQQRKLVTLLFLDIVGSTSNVSTRLDPEDTLEIMDQSLKRLAEPIENHGGHVTRYMGDGFKAIFGSPMAREDDAEMAVRAGLDTISTAREIAKELGAKWGINAFQVRVGVNTGLVALGGLTEAEDTVMGDTVNLAARLESSAPPGGLLISHETYKHVRGLFKVEPQEPILAKGFDDPINVYLIREAKPRAFHLSRRGVEGVETRMIGREAEFKYLQEALLTAHQDHEGQAVTVSGSAGVGKSRLLYEFLNWIELLPDQIVIYQGRVHQQTQNQPYALLHNLFAMHFQIQDDDAAQLVRQKVERGFGEVFGTQADGLHRANLIGLLLGFDFQPRPDVQDVLADAQALHDRGVMYLGDYFREASKLAPVALFLEDIHWADDSSLDVIAGLMRNQAELRMIIVCLSRPTIFERRPYWGEGYSHHHLLNLSALSKWESRQMVEEILKKVTQVPSALRELVVGGAEGNPFYIEELIKMLIENGVIATGEETWRVEPARLAEVDVPSTLTGVLQARLDSLPMHERLLLQGASVVGRMFWDNTLIYILSSDNGNLADEEITTALDSLRQKELIFRRQESAFAGAGEYIFKHAILRDVTYESVLKRKRRTYHALAAQWLLDHSAERAGEHIGLIADHLEHADQGEKAIRYLIQAGERAARQYANIEAVNFFSRALTLIPENDLETRYELHRGRGLTRTMLGEFDGARKDLESALKITHTTSDLQGEWRLLIDLGKLWASRDYTQSRDHFERALELARRMDDSAVLARSLNRIGNWYANDENPVRAAEYHLEALEIFEALGDKRGLASTLDLLGIANLLSANLSTSIGYYDQAISIFRELENRPRLVTGLLGRGSNISLSVLLANVPPNNPPDALRDLQEGIQIAQEIHSPTDEAMCQWTLGLLYMVYGQYGRALEVMQSGLQIASELGHREWEVSNRFALGILYSELFSPEDARKHLEQALALAEGLQSQYWIHHVVGALAGAYILQDDLPGAETCLVTAISSETPMDTMGKRYCWVRQAELILAQGNPTLALEITERLIATAPGMSPGDVITFLWMLKGEALAALGREGEAVSMMCTAKENAQKLGERYLLWRIHASLRRLHREMEQIIETQEEYSASQEIIEELVTSISDETLKDNFLKCVLKMLDAT